MPLTLCRRQIDSEGNLLCNIHNMAQIRLNTAERDEDLPRRADLRLNMAYFCQKMLADAPKIQVIMPKIAAKNFSLKLHRMYAHLYALIECSQLTLKLKFSACQIEHC